VFDDHNERHIAASLIKKRGKVAIRTKELEKEIAQLGADLTHIDDTIRLLDPDAVIVERMPNRWQPYHDGYFGP